MRVAVVIAALIAVAVSAFLLLALPARAHSFYSMSCCDERDCTPLPNGQVRIGRDGYLVPVGDRLELVPWGDRRIQLTPPEHSLGVEYHLCLRPVANNPIRCLYVPHQGG